MTEPEEFPSYLAAAGWDEGEFRLRAEQAKLFVPWYLAGSEEYAMEDFDCYELAASFLDHYDETRSDESMWLSVIEDAIDEMRRQREIDEIAPSGDLSFSRNGYEGEKGTDIVADAPLPTWMTLAFPDSLQSMIAEKWYVRFRGYDNAYGNDAGKAEKVLGGYDCVVSLENTDTSESNDIIDFHCNSLGSAKSFLNDANEALRAGLAEWDGYCRTIEESRLLNKPAARNLTEPIETWLVAEAFRVGQSFDIDSARRARTSLSVSQSKGSGIHR